MDTFIDSVKILIADNWPTYIGVVLLTYGIISTVRRAIPAMMTAANTLLANAVLSIFWGVLAAYVVQPSGIDGLWIAHAVFFAGFVFVGPLLGSFLAPVIGDVIKKLGGEQQDPLEAHMMRGRRPRVKPKAPSAWGRWF